MKVIILLLLSINIHANLSVSETLLKAYSPLCPSITTAHVQGSLMHAQIMGNIVREINQNSNCFQAIELERMSTDYSRLYENYMTYSDDRMERLELEKKIALYTSLSSSGSLSPDEELFLTNEILNSQASLINAQAGLGRFGDFRSRYATGARQVVNSVDGFLGTWSQNPQCFQSKVSLISSLLSNSLLATSAFAAPGTSLALSSGAMVIRSLGQFIQHFKENNLLEDIDEVQMPAALRCVSKALSDQFCSAVDTEKLVDSYRNDPITDGPNFEGLTLLKNHVSELAHWLDEVYAGSAITSEGDLVNREKPILQSELLKKIKRYLQTYGTLRTKVFSEISNDSQRTDAIVIGIDRLVSIMASPTLTPSPSAWGSSGESTSVENPIFVTRDKSLMPFQIFDPSITSIPYCGEDKCSLIEYVRKTGVELSISKWTESITNSLLIVEEVLELVNQERARTISVDAYSVLVGATRDIRGETNALGGLIMISDNAQRIIEFLTELGCQGRSRGCSRDGSISILHRYYPQITNIQKTKALTETVISLVEETFRPRSLSQDQLPGECRTDGGRPEFFGSDPQEEKSFEITSCITKILKLAERGNNVYFSKVRDMVSYELEARLANNLLDQDIEEIILSTKADLVTTLLNTYSPNNDINLSELVLGLKSSQNIVRNTAKNFFENFEDYFISAITETEISQMERSALCFRVLPFIYDTKDQRKFITKIYDRCKKAKMAFYIDGPSIEWKNYLVQTDDGSGFGKEKYKLMGSAEIRNCAFRKYNRRNKIYEQRREKELNSYEEKPL
ncbi:hypothetical protein BIY24_04885 [Halobacteriovorax marinus]|uniref:hypothetical protein n=1 Tax=Halobacteriovorax marinus TaxID=97084 RepID=UPI000BC328D7|nr:hypothetical protein [Halobacteriovorax marinus]ATH07294.1 hypothetical protein BIY24_04885 [Halobacteriovorax marinus]